MFALICKEGSQLILEQCRGLFDVQVITKMSTLEELSKGEQLEGIWLDSNLGITETIQSRIPNTPIFTIEYPFLVSDVMRWWETVRSTEKFASYDTAISMEPVPVTDIPKEQVTRQSPLSQIVVNPTFTRNLNLGESQRGDILRGTRKRKIPVFMLDSPKGGCGRSTLGAHMAYFGALQGKRIVILDFDSNGNIAAMLGLLSPTDSRGWRGDSLENAVRDQVCLVHDSGLYVWPSPQSKEVSLHNVEDAIYFLDLCMAEADIVFVDMPQGYTPIHQAILNFVTQVFLVVTPAVDSLDRIQVHIEQLLYAGFAQKNITAIVNQGKTRSDLRAMKQYLMPLEPHLLIPFDPKLKRKGGLSGKQLVKKCAPWWKETYGFSKPTKSKRRFGIFR